MFDRIRNFFSRDYRKRVARAKEGPGTITGVGEKVIDQKCPNCKIPLNIDNKVNADSSLLKIFNYLVCSTCGYQKRIKYDTI